MTLIVDLIIGGSVRKSEGLGTKIWPDGLVWAENKWPEYFWDGFGIGVCLAARPEKEFVHDLHFEFVLHYV